MEIESYRSGHEPAVARFNARLQAGGKGEYCFPESCVSKEFPKQAGRPVWRDYYVAVDHDNGDGDGDGGEVRGGYIVRGQPFWSRSSSFQLSFLKLPVAEGAIDSRYSTVGIELLQDVTAREPTVFALGMGGMKNPLPRILSKLGWQVVEVPFFYKIRRATRVFRQLKALRGSPIRSRGADIAACTGLAAIGARILQPPVRLRNDLSYQRVDGFDDLDDQLWRRARGDYDLAGERSAATLPLLYAPFGGRPERVRIFRNGTPIGWVTGLVTEMNDHLQFANLTVATLVDGFCCAGDIADVVTAGVAFLERQKPDLIVSNQLNGGWGEGLRRAGFRSGPSNFVFALSPAASGKLAATGGKLRRAHINRGDGDGPVHL